MSHARSLGPYELVSPLATGGMAEIFVARTAGIGGFEKVVALKVIHPNFSSDPQFVQMLVEEAKITVELQHANIVQTFDLGCVDDEYYIAMELIDGVDLFRLLRRASEKNLDFPFDVAAYIAREVCMGLDYAHRRVDSRGQAMGIIHRDISPQNVLVSRDGEVKIVDFGIAKAALRANQTEAGVIKGKYYYMSPEQAWGEPLDPRTDVFSTGIVLYEMIVGQMLYLDDDMERLLDKVRKARIAPPSSRRPKIPIALERIVMKALRKNREERYGSSAELGQALTQFLTTTAPGFSRQRVAQFVAAVLGENSRGQKTNPSLQKPQARDELPADENSLLTELPIAEPRGGAALDRPETTSPEKRRQVREPVGMRPPAQLTPGRPEVKPRAAPRTVNEETRPAALPTGGGGLQYEEDEATIVDSGNDTLLGARAVNTSDRPLPRRDSAAPTSELRVPDAGALDDEGEGEGEGEESTTVDRLSRNTGRGAKPRDMGDSTRPGGVELRPRQPADSPRRPTVPNRPVAVQPSGENTATNENLSPGAYDDPEDTRQMGSGEVMAAQVAMATSIPTTPIPASSSGPRPAVLPLPSTVIGGSAYGTGNHQRVATGSGAVDLRRGKISFAWILSGIAAATAVVVAIILLAQPGAPTVGAVQVVSAPAGAEVRIDGVAAADHTPLILHNVDTRRPHRLAVVLAGYEPWETQVTFASGAKEVHLQAILAPLTGRLEVTSIPVGAEVIVNGQVRGQTPATIDHLPRNEDLTVELRLRGYRAIRRTVQWNGQRAVALAVPLERAN